MLSFIILMVQRSRYGFQMAVCNGYMRGKHIALAVAAFLIILVGVPYTFLLSFWQWLIRSPKRMHFQWTNYPRLNAFISTYHAPYNDKHRYWTGLLMLVRVVLHIVSAMCLSSDPLIPLSVTAILIGGPFFLKGVIGRLYNVLVIDIMETVTLSNIQCLTIISLYKFKMDNKKQTIIAYISTSTTLLMLVGGVIYHIALLYKRFKENSVEVEVRAMVPLNRSRPAPVIVTHSIVRRPTP